MFSGFLRQSIIGRAGRAPTVSNGPIHYLRSVADMRETLRKTSNRFTRPPCRTTAAADRMLAARLVAVEALRNNCCPTCKGAVRINLALTGWVQCAQYGAAGFRADSSKPACGWQGFTE
jgi:hypothetical protein